MIRISFLGDISLNDSYNELYEKGEDPFREIKSLLQKSDLVVGNLECVSKGEKGFNILKKPRLFSIPETLNYLTNINTGALTLATNHVYDNLDDGFIKTVNVLDNLHIKHTGCDIIHENAIKPLKTEIGGINFCFLNYVTLDTNPSLPKNANVYPNIFSLEKCIDDLYKNKDADNKVVILHWGGRYEGSIFPGQDQRKIAKTLIKNGADLIIGHHSHTFQPFEKINGKYVFYSLGNFCFSDIISDGKRRSMSQKKFRESAIVEFNFGDKKPRVKVIPIINKNLYIFRNNIFIVKIKWRNFIFTLFTLFPFIWHLNHFLFLKILPIVKGIFRKDTERNIGKRIKDFKFAKIRTILKK